MYDLHCHILPGYDDGPASWEAALELARTLVAEGVTTVGATPHSPASSQSQSYDIAALRSSVMRLREQLQRAKISLQVVLGTEIAFDVGLVEQIKAGTLLGYGSSRAVLLESPNDFIPEALETIIYQLQVAGYRVVLAHPERIRSVQHDPNTLLPLVERGVQMQVTAASIVGSHGERLQATALQLLSHGMVQLIASDAHAAQGVRAPFMAAAVEKVRMLQGAPMAQQLVEITPYALLHDDPLPPAEPSPVQTKRPRRWWFGR